MPPAGAAPPRYRLRSPGPRWACSGRPPTGWPRPTARPIRCCATRRPTWRRCGRRPPCWRCGPGRGPVGAAPRDVWHLLAEVAPELGEWAAFFASCSDTRAAAEAGITRLVGRRDADDLLRQAEQFVGIVREIVPLR